MHALLYSVWFIFHTKPGRVASGNVSEATCFVLNGMQNHNSVISISRGDTQRPALFLCLCSYSGRSQRHCVYGLSAHLWLHLLVYLYLITVGDKYVQVTSALAQM